MGMAYEWNINNVPVDAQTAGEYMEGLAVKHGMLTAKLLVDESREEGAVMHNCFEWNDAIAAENYREQQAGYIIRNIKVVPVDDGEQAAEPIRTFVNVVDDESGQRGYIQTQVALGSEKFSQQVLRNAYNDLCAFRNRYIQYKGVAEKLQPVFSAIDRLGEELPD